MTSSALSAYLEKQQNYVPRGRNVLIPFSRNILRISVISMKKNMLTVMAGSFDTARRVVEAVFGGEAPVTFQYDFIRIKRRRGKISSSTGEVISLADVLEVYPPEIVRYLFAGTSPYKH